MQKGKSIHIIKGMNKDMSAATMNSESAFDAKNIRITPIDEGGLLVVTNEKGNIEIPIVNITRENMVIEGNILGTQVLNNYVIIFTHNEDFDRIYRLEKKEDTFEGLLLYQGNLNFSNDNPIEGLAVYENEEVQKVYWIDGRNQARVINFVVPEEKRNTWIDTSFDFIPELRLEEEVTTSLKYGNGSFHSGVIQYAFTYYNKYGQESNIFYTTSLISVPIEGQASPEDIIGCYIKLIIKNVDTNFDYIRVYSIHRTSLNSTPDVRLVKDVNIEENILDGDITIIDDGIIGSSIDATELLYKGGETIIPKTLTQKDNTLFLGNTILENNYIKVNSEIIYDFIDGGWGGNNRGLLKEENYIVGIQGQYKSGKWSNIFGVTLINNKGIGTYNIRVLPNRLPQDVKDIINANFKKWRLVYSPVALESQNILISEGLITPTVFGLKNRYYNTYYAQPTWDMYPMVGMGQPLKANTVDNWKKYKYLDIESMIEEYKLPQTRTEIDIKKYYPNYIFDTTIVNLYSPEIEFKDLSNIDLNNYKLQIYGVVFFTCKDYMQINSKQSPTIGAGFLGSSENYPWEDSFLDYTYDSMKQIAKASYKSYIWQNNHLNNMLEDFYNDSDKKTYVATLMESKKLTRVYDQSGRYVTTSANILDFSSCSLNYFNKDGNDLSILKYSYDTNIFFANNVNDIIATNNNYTIGHEYDHLVGDKFNVFNDPIEIKYNSGPNLSIKLSTSGLWALPRVFDIMNTELEDNGSYRVFDFATGAESAYVNRQGMRLNFEKDKYANHALGYLGRVIQKNSPIIDINESSLLWYPLGNPELINTSIESTGDTCKMSYKCLKISTNNGDLNNTNIIVDFDCFTRVNLDGVYSNKKLDYLNINPENYNKFNSVYNQLDNIFNYRNLKESYYKNNYFPNVITWTKEKQAGADVDTWTNITMASTLDLDGDKGAITSLNTFNNEIYAFQERGLSNILFNSRVQIPTSDGVPIEISNGYKVQGKRYVSNSIGCNNKWSITESPNGIYFIDSDTNSLYLFNGTINSLSDRFGLRGWLSNNNSNKEWNTVTYENFRSFYDRNNGDVYFIKDDDCLCFSELLGQFISFYDYTRVPSMFNVEGDLFSIKNNKLWKHYSTDNTSIYGEDKEYYITLLSNTDPLRDKIFSNIICRADGSNNTFFNKLEVWNEYQKGEVDLTSIINKPSNLKQKFRTWRVNIPRDNTHKLDRMRNPWLYIKLIGKENNIKLYGTEVEFFM